MKKQIAHISVHQSSKVIALISFFISAIFIVPGSIIAFVISREISSLAFLLIPFFYLLITYIVQLLVFWSYNVVARSFGGVEFDLEDHV
ncbi:MAG: hypothetical protein H7A37_02140 [Chlamydiales bacterium]|nr:hypothetical protein [Chlamydiia bacterium]MCP5507091.1 hypothetical protein [Chlamydiales bacterium]